MKVLLAGLNIDVQVLKEWRRFVEKVSDYLNPNPVPGISAQDEMSMRNWAKQLISADNITPETISAAYARISRDPRPVDILRGESRHWVGKARRSNKKIIFGLGHSSVAEHAVFNFDIIGVSRYLSEYIQHHRLCSFTEKSQRYIRLGKDYIVPDEVHEIGLSDEFSTFVLRQFQRYNEICDALIELGVDPEEAGEDARYVLPFCVTTQMGMTINARNLEYLLRRAASSGCSEFKTFGETLYRTVDGVAPSVVKYTGATPYLSQTEAAVDALIPASEPISDAADVDLRFVTPDADREVMRALAFRLGKDLPESVTDEEMSEFFKEIFRRAQPWDPAPRELEYAVARFEIVISAAAYAQMKRHRMATMSAGPYDIRLGIMVPPAFRDNKAGEILTAAAEESAVLVRRIHERSPGAAPYALLSAHRRRVLIQISARELIHLSRMREDIHAQWDIRDLVAEMLDKVRPHMPNCLMTAVGKHRFDENHRDIYGD